MEQLASLLAALGREPDELISINNFSRGFTEFLTVEQVSESAELGDGDWYFSVNPLRERPKKGRGKSQDFPKLTTLWIDLDAGKVDCQALLDRMTDVVGVPPVAVVHTGSGGIHPYWRLTEPITPSLLRAWGRLVKVEAKKLGGKADSVFDPARVLRLPGVTRPNGTKATLARVGTELVKSADLFELVKEFELTTRNAVAENAVAFDTWEPAERTCPYVSNMIDGWADEDLSDRHHWLLNKIHRLMAALRLGCITAEDFERGKNAAIERFSEAVLTTPNKKRDANEIMSIIEDAKDKTQYKTKERLYENELGSHTHAKTPDQEYEELLERERLRRRVRRTLDREEADAIAELSPRFQILTLDQRKELDDPIPRVDKIMPYEANTLFVAQNKTGKTIIALNLVRSLLSGELFLNQLDVRPLAESESVAYLNYEVSGALLEKWADRLGIADDPRFIPLHMRDCRNPLRFPSDREALAAELRRLNVKVVIVDTFSRAFNGSGEENSNKDVVPWLLDLNAFARVEAGATDLALLAHAGHNPDHARGASALEDWPDNKVYLKKEPGDKRSIRTEGRMDEQLEKSLTEYDEETHRVTLGYTTANVAAADKQQTHRERLSESLAELEAEWKLENDGEFPGKAKSLIKGVKALHRDTALSELVELGYVEQVPGRTAGTYLYRNIRPYGLVNNLEAGHLVLMPGGSLSRSHRSQSFPSFPERLGDPELSRSHRSRAYVGTDGNGSARLGNGSTGDPAR